MKTLLEPVAQPSEQTSCSLSDQLLIFYGSEPSAELAHARIHKAFDSLMLMCWCPKVWSFHAI